MKNIDFLKSAGINLTTKSLYGLNQQANELLATQSEEAIVVTLPEDSCTILLTKNDHHAAYMSNVWENLNLEERMRVLFWTKSNFCKKYNLKNKPFVFFDNIKNNDQLTPAYVTFPDKLHVNLNEFMCNSSGYQCLEYIVHECTHLLQYKTFCEIPEDLLNFSRHYNTSENPDQTLMQADLVELSYDGKNYNYKTKQYEYLSPELKKRLLYTKNIIVNIQPIGDNPFCKKKYTKSQEEFEQFVNNLLYYASPFEHEAYMFSKNYVVDVIKKNVLNFPKSASKSDRLDYDYTQKEILIHKSRKHTLQKYFNMNCEQIYNMEVTYQCYKFLLENPFYGTKEVATRKKKFEQIYNAKFKPKYTSNLKTFLQNSSTTTIEDNNQVL